MEISSENQNDLIEKYVTGLMSADEALEFEAFILNKPDWLKKVNRARELFEEIYEQQWQNELEQTLAQHQAGTSSVDKAETETAMSWLSKLFMPVLSMAVGALAMFVLIPQQVVDTQPLGKSYSNTYGTERGLESADKPIELPLEKDVDHIALKLSSGDDLSKRFKIKAIVGSDKYERDGYKPDNHGMVLFSLARDFKHNELISVSLLNQNDGTVHKEYVFVIKEN